MDPFVAEIRIFPFNFAPKGWAWCDGQLLPITQNTALFSLLGTTYGGDGKSTFALPDLQGCAPMHPGQGPGLMAGHPHALRADTVDAADTNVPSPNASLALSTGGTLYQAATNSQLADQALAPAGGDQPHNNLQPYLTLYFNIALQGVFPPRT
jgi:microcystin-dependent protein